MGIVQARILEWVAVPSSMGSSQPRDQTQVFCTAGGFFTVWATREAHEYWSGSPIPSPGDLPNPGIEPESPALQADSLPAELPGKPTGAYMWVQMSFLVFFHKSNLWAEFMGPSRWRACYGDPTVCESQSKPRETEEGPPWSAFFGSEPRLSEKGQPMVVRVS